MFSLARPFAHRPALTGLATLLLVLLVAGCAGSQEARSHEVPRGAPDENVVTADEIENAPASSIQELLQGRVAGVTVIEQGGGIAVRIRGVNSILGSNEPLYVIDGIPVTPGPNGYLSINPYDVKSIEVLKGTNAAIYGVRGANGVIVVTTKRGGDR